MHRSLPFVLLLLSMSRLASAGDSSWAVGAGVNYARSDFQLNQISDNDMCTTRPGLSCDLDSTDLGARILVTYRLNLKLSIEAGYIAFGNVFKIDLYDSIADTTGVVRQKHSTGYLVLQGYYPLTPRWALTATGGIHGWAGDAHYSEPGILQTNGDSDFDSIYGLGLLYRRHTGDRIEFRWERFSGNGDRAYVVDSGGGLAETARADLDLLSLVYIHPL